ncbi:MAG: hypothetical protein ACK56F_04445, partial [bacterium]
LPLLGAEPALEPGPGELDQQHHQSGKDQEENRLHDPGGQHPAQLEIQRVDGLQHQPNNDQGHQGQPGNQPQTGAGVHGGAVTARGIPSRAACADDLAPEAGGKGTAGTGGAVVVIAQPDADHPVPLGLV